MNKKISITENQMRQYNRMLGALQTIHKKYCTPAQLRKQDAEFGPGYEETLEMAYENIQNEARAASKGIKWLTIKKIVKPVVLILSLFFSSLSYGQTKSDLIQWATDLEQKKITPADFKDLLAGARPDTSLAIRDVSNELPSNFWRHVDHSVYRAKLYQVIAYRSDTLDIYYLDSKKRPLKPWIRVWEN